MLVVLIRVDNSLTHFTIFDFAQGLYELNVVTEAARHGARSLTSRTTLDRKCPGDIDGGWRNPNDEYRNFGPVSCDSALTGENSLANTALGSACYYLQQAGYTDLSNFEVSGTISLNYFDNNSVLNPNAKEGDQATAGTTGGVDDVLGFVSVSARRAHGSSCTVCKLTGLQLPNATITLPLNPWQLAENKSYIGFSRGCY